MRQIALGLKLIRGYVVSNFRLFLIGFLISIISIYSLPKLLPVIIKPLPRTIGLVGNYTLNTLPKNIQQEISLGLVQLDSSGLATRGAAASWIATDSGKTFMFNLDTTLVWHDQSPLNSSDISYNLKGVEIQRPDAKTVKLILKENFSPLLTLLSQPIFKTGLVGLNVNRVENIKLNGRFLSSLSLVNHNDGSVKTYRFYPTEKALINALKLGSVRQVSGLFNTSGLENNRSYSIDSSIDYHKEAVIFFNTQKKPFDEKSFRQGLVYALPDTDFNGEMAYGPLPPNNWSTATTAIKKYPQNTSTAQKLIKETKIILATQKDLEPAAKAVAEAWKAIGLNVDTQIVDIPPINFDAYLAFIDLPDDPDQYTLWHSTQTGNIAGYKSFKVDKLLEEGRKAFDLKERKEIYADFQKAITEDVPAAFLFYPRVYTITRSLH